MEGMTNPKRNVEDCIDSTIKNLCEYINKISKENPKDTSYVIIDCTRALAALIDARAQMCK